MPTYAISASVNTTLPGSVLVGVTSDAARLATVLRVEGSLEGQPVRNFSATVNGIESVIDCEAPLGRPVHYRLVDRNGALLATSNTVVCPEDVLGRSIIRSVLKPTVAWCRCCATGCRCWCGTRHAPRSRRGTCCSTPWTCPRTA